MKILVTGVHGQLGYDVCKVLSERSIEHKGVDREDFDLTDFDATRAYVKKYAPDAVIHCSAWTAVDKAEDELDTVKAINEGGTRAIAEACKDLDAKMVYISTDYVFPGTGDRFYEPDDPTGPLGAYGMTKLGANKRYRNCWINILLFESPGYLVSMAIILSARSCVLQKHGLK